jgi:hypothetical protein
MDDPADDPPRPLPGPRQVARIVLPVFAASTLVMVVGVVLALTHHRSIGLVLVVVGAVGGFAVRARLMIRSQQGPRTRP